MSVTQHVRSPALDTGTEFSQPSGPATARTWVSQEQKDKDTKAAAASGELSTGEQTDAGKGRGSKKTGGSPETCPEVRRDGF